MRRLPVYLLIDCSGSMAGEPIEAVRHGVRALINELRADPQARENVSISVITFSNSAEQAVPLTALEEFREPVFYANGATALGSALRLLRQCVEREVVVTAQTRKSDFKPLVFLMTDGSPTDNWEQEAENLRQVRLGNVIACAVGDAADQNVLKRITESVVKLNDQRAHSLSAFFKWCSSSISAAAHAGLRNIATENVVMPPPASIEWETPARTKANENVPQSSPSSAFPSTDWDQLSALKTARHDERTTILDSIISRYWKPLFEWVTRRGHSEEDAQDIIQDFFADAVKRDLFEKADRRHGRFENFLIKSLKSFIIYRKRTENASKRCPQQGLVSLDELVGEQDDENVEPLDNDSPAVLFQRAWSAEIIQRALNLFERECQAAGKQAHFEVFRQRLVLPELEGADPPPLSELASRLGVEVKDAANYLVTARRAFVRLLRNEIREYAASETELNEEVFALMQSLGYEEKRATISKQEHSTLRQPGDHRNLRAVSSKVDQEDIPKILPSELATNPTEQHRGTPEVPGGRIDDVHFSVTSPRCVPPGCSFMLDVWAHLKRQRQAVIKQAREAIAGGEIVIQSKGPIQVARGTVLSVLLKIDGMSVKDPQDTIYWKGEIGNARFPVIVPDDAKEGSRAGLATIHLDGVQIGKIHFSLMVGREASAENDVPFQVQHHRKAFASYASPDRDEVLGRIQGMQKIAPDLDVRMDVITLRSGEDWEKKLWELIPESDVFYLFWSAAAKASPWVEKEWRCALDRRGEEFIDPVPLVSPEEVRPPDELAKKHFNDWILAYRRGRPKPSE